MKKNPTLEDDALLASRIMQHDRKAEQAFYDRLHNGLFFFLLKYKFGWETTKDLTITTLGKAMVSIRKGLYTPDFMLSTWTYAVARNLAIDFYRKSDRQRKTYKFSDLMINNQHGQQSELFFQPSGAISSEDIILSKEKRAILIKAVADLPRRYRELVMYRFFEQHSYLECAAHFEKPEGTVKAQIFRAKGLLANMPDIINYFGRSHLLDNKAA